MSQPLFNQLRSTSMVSTPHGHAGGTQLGLGMSANKFPSSGLPFLSQNPALGPLVGVGLGCSGSLQTQNPNAMGLNPFGGMVPQASSQQTSAPVGLAQPGGFYASSGFTDYGNNMSVPANSVYTSDSERRGQYGFLSGVPSALNSSGKTAEGQYMPSSQSKLGTQGGFQRDFYIAGTQGQEALGFSGEQNTNHFHQGNHKDLTGPVTHGTCTTSQWPNQANFSKPNNPELVPNSGAVWTTSGQPFHMRGELYNPEEPTTDPKFSPAAGQHPFSKLGTSNQGFVGFGQLRQAEEQVPPGPVVPLQPHQLNDFHAVTPAHLPHVCTICNKKVFNLKFLQRKSIVSRVVHICNLPEGSCTENDVINLGLPFGKVTNYILMKSTHQAFLEMAYAEAAQAMVQYYQQTPATVHEQKLLIRMSKRYKELQLKKPGKDVDSIIHNIHSQREKDVMQEERQFGCPLKCPLCALRYSLERTRSRSPISRSLSPRSHSTSFTSCSPAHSPLGPARLEWSNGLEERRASWDWSPHARTEGDEQGWGTSEKDPADNWMQDRRKHYLKGSEKLSPRSSDEWVEELRGNRERYPKNSPRNVPYTSYRSKEDEYYKKESKHKSDGPQKHHQRHDIKSKRRDPEPHHRAREGKHSGSESQEDPSTETRASRTPEDRGRKGNGERGRSKKTNLQPSAEKEERVPDSEGEEIEHKIEERLMSPDRNGKESGEPNPERNHGDQGEWESGSGTEGESWYPSNMEELVTVDEVGEEEDCIIEPDISELQEAAQARGKPAELTDSSSAPAASVELRGLCSHKKSDERAGGSPAAGDSAVQVDGSKELIPNQVLKDEVCELQQEDDLRESPAQDLQTAFKEECSCVELEPVSPDLPHQEGGLQHQGALIEGCNPLDVLGNGDVGKLEMKVKSAAEEMVNDDIPEEHKVNSKSQRESLRNPEEGANKPQSHSHWEEENVFGELSIPLGVEFVVLRTGFYCKLCGLFYTSEETAKTTHCRSTVHYKNLQGDGIMSILIIMYGSAEIYARITIQGSYQQTPATVHEQKLLIRMSKRYKELQLKKPGKDVDSIIHNIHSQREKDVMQEERQFGCPLKCPLCALRYSLERTRSRSPISRSLSPRSHSTSFTSCSPAHSPLGPARLEWSNGLEERRASWDWSPHARTEGDEQGWGTSEKDPADNWMQDRRKHYLKGSEKLSPRSSDEWVEELRGNRERYPKNSPRNVPYTSYRSKEDEYYKKESKHKSDRPQKHHQRHDIKSKRRDPEPHHRAREGKHSGSESQEDPSTETRASRTPEDRGRKGNGERGRSKKTNLQPSAEKEERVPDSEGEEIEHKIEERLMSPDRNGKESGEPNPERNHGDQGEWESGSGTEGESWYPSNMEELVTVDEVGEEEDCIIEPDISELQEAAQARGKPAELTDSSSAPAASVELRGLCSHKKSDERAGGSPAAGDSAVQVDGSKELIPNQVLKDVVCELQQEDDLRESPAQDLQTAFKEECSCVELEPVSPDLPHQEGGLQFGPLELCDLLPHFRLQT
ncbi:UNVERIFIED_CONTAM: hypothetical protein FKN15_031479 [Acipenser sinensis]